MSKLAAGVAFVAPDRSILLLLRSEGEENYPGHWALPGGKGDEGEDAETAARRELKEEIGETPEGEFKLLDEVLTPTGMTFYTFVQAVGEQFAPKLNAEHQGYAWFDLGKLPSPMHPSVAKTIKNKLASVAQDADSPMLEWMKAQYLTKKLIEPLCAAQDASLAFDRASVRTIDADGHLHVAITNISKANVCPYLGKEINAVMDGAPGWKPLIDDKIYYLLRDPEELEKAAHTFNNKPLLSEHIPVNAVEHHPEAVIGSTGTDAEFEYPYLRNSIVVWTKEGIDAIESEAKKELSAAYRYRADMTPGNYKGEQFDGRMVDIIGNHVAVVVSGRAGSDVVVGDSHEEMEWALLEETLGTLAFDADFDESKHPRAENGEFGKGSGGAQVATKSAQKLKASPPAKAAAPKWAAPGTSAPGSVNGTNDVRMPLAERKELRAKVQKQFTDAVAAKLPLGTGLKQKMSIRDDGADLNVGVYVTDDPSSSAWARVHIDNSGNVFVQQHDTSLDPKLRGKGLGGGMVSALIAGFQALGATKNVPVHVNTNPDFWERISKKHGGIYAQDSIDKIVKKLQASDWSSLESILSAL